MCFLQVLQRFKSILLKYIIFRIIYIYIYKSEGEILKFLQVIIIFYRVKSLNKLKCDDINDINNVKVYNIYNIYKVILFWIFWYWNVEEDEKYCLWYIEYV